MPATRETAHATRRVAPRPPTADELLRRKAAELEAVFEALADGLLVVDGEARIVEANRAMVALLGYDQKAALLGPVAQGLSARVTRTDGGPLTADDLGIRRVLRDGETRRGVCVLRIEHGGPRWIETLVSPIRDGRGAVLGGVVTARDVTDARRRERELALIARVSSLLLAATDVPAALRALADRCVDDLADWCVAYLLDPGTDVLRPLALRLRNGAAGAEHLDLLGQRPPRLAEGFAGAAVRADQVLLLAELGDDAIRRHAGNGPEAQVARRLGLRAVVAAPLPGPNGPVGALCVGWRGSRRRPDEQDARLVDDLARRAGLAVEQLRCLRGFEESLERLELVLDSMGAGMLILGGDGRAILVNAAAREMVGLEEDGIGRTLPELLGGLADRFEDPRELDEFLVRSASRELASRGALRLREPHAIDIEWLVTPVQEADGPVLGQVVIWVDVTYIRATERVKDGLASDLSEALRSPLQAISTHAVQTLRRARRVSGDPNLAHGLEVILRSARQAAMHVNDLVDAARFDIASLTLEPVDVDVHDVLQQAIDRARAMTTIHRFRLDVPPGIDPLRCDPDRVRQAVLHVLANAIKYWPEGGQVTVRARPQGDGLLISVRDRGLGVPLELQERVFERFFRIAGDPARRRIRGNGLGLYLVRGVVEAHGGSVWIESTGVPGNGTTVHLLLPWTPPGEPPR